METNVAREMRGPKLLLEITNTRRPYWRRFRLLLVVFLVTLVAWFALEQAAAQVEIDPLAISIGRLAAAAILLLTSIRAVIQFVRWRTRPDETIRFFNQGFSWESGATKARYRWEKIQIFREGGGGLYLGKRALVQWGGHTLIMDDKRIFRLRPRHGDLRQLARLIRPYAAEVTGIRMAQRLRAEKPVRLHPRLIAWPGGLEIHKKELPWAALHVAVKGRRLIIRAKENGKVRTVGTFDIRKVDNLGGFMELATTTIQNHRAR
jgi:hypothetical protein